jgi:hypothetical protein
VSGAVVAVLIALAQGQGAQDSLKSALPRFLLATGDSTVPTAEVDPRGLPGYTRRVSVTASPLPRREALRLIATQSGVQFVYANDLIAADDTVQFSARDLSVVDALIDALRGGSIDVAVSSSGNAVLVRRTRATAPLAPSDTIRGRVLGDSGQAVGGALIRVTMAPNRELFEAYTDSTGAYQLVIPNGTGDYLVHISAPSQPAWRPVRKRVTRASIAQRQFVVDAELKPAPAQRLEQVTVSAERLKPTRTEPLMGTVDVGGAQSDVGGVYAALAPELGGNLLASVQTLPGVTAAPDGFSVLGLPGSQNRVTLNGMSFAGAGVPRDARVFTSVATSTFDPSRGWFGGAEARLSIQAGNFLQNVRSSLTLDHPAMQSGGQLATRLGQRYQNVVAGLGGDGLLLDDRLAYSFGLQLQQRQSELETIASGNADFLQRAGVAADTAARFRDLVGSLGVPVWRSGQASTPLSQSASVIARLNTPPYDMKTREPARTSVGVIVAAAVDGSDGPTDVLSTPASAARAHGASGNVQFLYSRFATPFVLHDITMAASINDRRQSPGLMVPRASVLTASSFADGSSSLALLGFGGGGTDAHSREATWELTSETRFYPAGKPKHQVKINSALRIDALERTVNANALGSFAYNSLGDVALGRPALFSRTLTAPAASARAMNAFVSIGDMWRPNAVARLQYGVRVEGNRFLAKPAHNAALASALGLDNSRAPDRLHISPRLGFTWYFAKRPSYGGYLMNGFGVYPTPPVGVLRGGIGEFRSLLPASVLADPAANTGLPGGRQQLTCVGDAVPVPDWAAWVNGTASVPTNCVNATGTMQDASPSVSLVSRRYDAPRSWRANLSWTASVGAFTLFAEGMYSLNLSQTGWVDRNFSGAPRFTLADDGRPVFVPPSAIASSGALVTGGARRRAEYGAVRELVSDLRSEAAQLTLTARSTNLRRFGGRQTVSLAYTLRSVRSQERGFDGSTLGDPTERTWGRSPLDVRHGLVLQVGHGAKWANFTLAGVFASGRPFTPRLGSDVNGDGLANDRAYIVDPSRTGDPALASEMSKLLAGAPAKVRRCLERQLGQVASRNGCEGPWTADLNARIGFNTWQLGERWRPWNVALFITNPLGGLDAALHGARLRGWGSSAYPDPTLYHVTGFNAATRRYQYVVNPRFADTRPTVSTVRTPFRITLDIQRSLGPTAAVQQLNRLLGPGRGRKGEKLTSDELVARYRRSVLDPYESILQESDSLLLQPAQIARLQAAQASYRARVDSIWVELAHHFASLPDKFDGKQAYALQEATIDRAWDVGRVHTQATLAGILDAMQLKLLPYPASMYFAATKPIKGLRYYRP